MTQLLESVLALLHRYFILEPFEKGVIIAFICVTYFLVFTIGFLKKAEWKKLICLGLLINGIFLIYVSTVLSRFPFWNTWEILRSHSFSYNLIPFHSYVKMFTGHSNYILEVLFNILVFMPAGFLLPQVCEKITWRAVFIFSFLITLSIELMQLFFKCGIFETDDIIHNVLGCLLGFLLYKRVKALVEAYKKKQEVYNEVE